MLICRELPIDEKCIEHVQDGPTFQKLVDNDEATIDDASDEDEDEDVCYILGVLMILTNAGTWFLAECSRPDTNGVQS